MHLRSAWLESPSGVISSISLGQKGCKGRDEASWIESDGLFEQAVLALLDCYSGFHLQMSLRQ